MVKVWCKCDQNQIKALQVVKEKSLNVEEMTNWPKAVYPLKLCCGTCN